MELQQSHKQPSTSRLISSKVISGGESSDNMTTETIRYVEVPVMKEEVVQINRKEIYEIEKMVPVYDYQYRERVVEVPQIETINTEVEVGYSNPLIFKCYFIPPNFVI